MGNTKQIIYFFVLCGFFGLLFSTNARAQENPNEPNIMDSEKMIALHSGATIHVCVTDQSYRLFYNRPIGNNVWRNENIISSARDPEHSTYEIRHRDGAGAITFTNPTSPYPGNRKILTIQNTDLSFGGNDSLGQINSIRAVNDNEDNFVYVTEGPRCVRQERVHKIYRVVSADGRPAVLQLKFTLIEHDPFPPVQDPERLSFNDIDAIHFCIPGDSLEENQINVSMAIDRIDLRRNIPLHNLLMPPLENFDIEIKKASQVQSILLNNDQGDIWMKNLERNHHQMLWEHLDLRSQEPFFVNVHRKNSTEYPCLSGVPYTKEFILTPTPETQTLRAFFTRTYSEQELNEHPPAQAPIPPRNLGNIRPIPGLNPPDGELANIGEIPAPEEWADNNNNGGGNIPPPPNGWGNNIPDGKITAQEKNGSGGSCSFTLDKIPPTKASVYLLIIVALSILWMKKAKRTR